MPCDPTGFLEFHKWAREHSLSYELNYSEGEDVFTVDIHSAAPAESYHQKRCYDLRDIPANWSRATGFK